MSSDAQSPTATAHSYATGRTQQRIEAAIRQAGKDPDHLATDDLAVLEDFHSLGRLASLGLIELAAVTGQDRVLDAGSGIGGTARLLAAQTGCQITTVDLTDEYCETSRWLNRALGLDDRIDVHQGNVLELPFTDASFDVVISQHVQMNIADKSCLYAEARRVLAPGGRLALWDVTAGPVQPIHFPVPWSETPAHSHLIAPDALRTLLVETGFTVTAWNDLTEPATTAMQQVFSEPPAELGLHVFVPDFANKATNLIRNAREDRIRLIQAVLAV